MKRKLLAFVILLAILPSMLAATVSVQVALHGPVVPPAPPAATDRLPWLHVEHPSGGRPYVADETGRYRILRGAVVAGMIDFWSGANLSSRTPAPFFPIDPDAYTGACPVNSSEIRAPPVCEADFREMRDLGFDVVKVGLSWSLLEPTPGRYDITYLDRISQVVGWARAYGIYVILDMHQNSWSRFLGDDSRSPLASLGQPPSLSDHTGAPAWAASTFGLPSVKFAGKREFNPAVQASMTNFWLNRDLDWLPRGDAPGTRIQDHYIGALAALARRFRDDSTVAGFNVFNEPQQGFIAWGAFEDAFLMPFYRRVIDALAGTADGAPCPASSPSYPICGYPDLGIQDRRHIFFLDANVFRATTDLPTHLSLPLSSDPNLVYGFHAYTHVYTLDSLFGGNHGRSWYPVSYDQSFAFADVGARWTGAALMVTEYGDNPSDDPTILSQELTAEERWLTGTTFWTWKENCGYGTTWGIYAGVYGDGGDQRCSYDRSTPDPAPKPDDGGIRRTRADLLVRGCPRAVAGMLLGYSYDPAAGFFTMQASSGGSVAVGASAQETIVYLPPGDQATVRISGGARMDRIEPAAGGARIIYVAPTGGRYSVSA